jgi:hypothetical protein
MYKVDLTRIAENNDTLNALHSLKNINQELSVYQVGPVTDKIHNENSKILSWMNIACAFHLGSCRTKHVVYSIPDIKKVMLRMEISMKKIRSLLLRIKDTLLVALCSSVDENQQVVINENIRDLIEEMESIVLKTRWNNVPFISNCESVSYLEFSSIPEGINIRKIYMVSGFDISSLGITRTDSIDLCESGKFSIEAKSAIDNAIIKLDQVINEIREFIALINFMEKFYKIFGNKTQLIYERIKNTSMAEEQVEASKYLILQQTSAALRAQANIPPQSLLSLFF